MMIEELRAAMMEAMGIDATNEHYWPYWDALAGVAWALGTSGEVIGAELLARTLCRQDGNDPDKESIGLGGLIPRDQPYRLWEAWMVLAVAAEAVLIKHHVKEAEKPA